MKDVDPKAFGQRVRELRSEIGVTTPKLAKITGISQQNLSSIEKGLVKRTGRIVELARALSTSPEWLQFGDGQRVVLPKNPREKIDALVQSLKPNQAGLLIQFLEDLTDESSGAA